MPSSFIGAIATHRERFVDLEQVDVGDFPAGLLQHLLDRADRRGREPFRLLRMRGVRDDARERLRVRASLASSALISTVAAAPSEMLDELAAVTVPSLRNAGFSVGNLRRRRTCPAARPCRRSTSPLRPLTVHRHDFVLERAGR